MQIEQKKLFDYEDVTPLLSDVGARMQGLPFFDGYSSLSFLGIRVDLKDDTLMFLKDDVSDYGIDALRVVLLENKFPLTHAQKASGWRLADKLWLNLKDLPLGDFEQLNNSLYYPFIQCLQVKDWKKAWFKLKTIFNNHSDSVLAYCLYPFMPHLVQSIHSEIHSKMAQFWSFVLAIEAPRRYFIEINGRQVCDFYPNSCDDFEKIQKEALFFSAVQNKIKDKEIKKIIHIDGKGINFVV